VEDLTTDEMYLCLMALVRMMVELGKVEVLMQQAGKPMKPSGVLEKVGLINELNEYLLASHPGERLQEGAATAVTFDAIHKLYEAHKTMRLH
jgi:hypothetical protein